MAGDAIKFRGKVTNSMGNAIFKVQIEEKDAAKTEVICTISGNIRKNNIRILDGDFVDIEVSPYDMTRGRIVFRYK